MRVSFVVYQRATKVCDAAARCLSVPVHAWCCPLSRQNRRMLELRSLLRMVAAPSAVLV